MTCEFIAISKLSSFYFVYCMLVLSLLCHRNFHDSSEYVLCVGPQIDLYYDSSEYLLKPTKT